MFPVLAVARMFGSMNPRDLVPSRWLFHIFMEVKVCFRFVFFSSLFKIVSCLKKDITREDLV